MVRALTEELMTIPNGGMLDSSYWEIPNISFFLDLVPLVFQKIGRAGGIRFMGSIWYYQALKPNSPKLKLENWTKTTRTWWVWDLISLSK